MQICTHLSPPQASAQMPLGGWHYVQSPSTCNRRCFLPPCPLALGCGLSHAPQSRVGMVSSFLQFRILCSMSLGVGFAFFKGGVALDGKNVFDNSWARTKSFSLHGSTRFREPHTPKCERSYEGSSFISYFHTWGPPGLVMRKSQECRAFPAWGPGSGAAKVQCECRGREPWTRRRCFCIHAIHARKLHDHGVCEPHTCLLWQGLLHAKFVESLAQPGGGWGVCGSGGDGHG